MITKCFCPVCSRKHSLKLEPKEVQSLVRISKTIIRADGLIQISCEECHPNKYHLSYDEWLPHWEYFSIKTGKFQKWRDRHNLVWDPEQRKTWEAIK